MFRVFFFLLFLGGLSWSQTPFRLSLSEARRNYDPHSLRTSSGQYINQQLFRHFYRFAENNDYVTELGEKCRFEKTRWICQIKKDLKWSDGTPLTADDFVLSFRRILTTPAPRADLLFGIKNAKAVHDKKLPATELGIKSLNDTEFEIQWVSSQSASRSVLMSPLLVPLPRGQFRIDAVSGPYKIKSQSPTKITMEPNPYYFKKNSRPGLEWLLFDENLTLEAYDRGELDLVRRVPTSLIPQYSKKDGYRLASFIRLDALVMGPSLENDFNFRKRLALSLNFDSMKLLFNSVNRPGCIGLPLDFYDGPEICYQFQKPIPKAPDSKKKLTFVYSALGGEDHRRLSEWLQSQWKNELGVDLKVLGLENKIYLTRLEKDPPDIFRRGYSPENPSCYGALSSFTTDHPDNFLKFKNAEFDKVISKLSDTSHEISNPSSKKLCRKALEILMESYKMIPTGRFGFSMMIRPGWNQVKINALNHLDLSELSKIPTK